jgi:hypothetical protein
MPIADYTSIMTLRGVRRYLTVLGGYSLDSSTYR